MDMTNGAVVRAEVPGVCVVVVCTVAERDDVPASSAFAPDLNQLVSCHQLLAGADRLE